MKLILDGDRIAATATDAYDGPNQWLPAPEGFDVGRMSKYRVVDGVPAIPVPQAILRAQGKLALIQAGMWPAVLAYVESIEDATERAVALVAINDRETWVRDDPFLMSMAAGLGLNDEQVDDLFLLADGL